MAKNDEPAFETLFDPVFDAFVAEFDPNCVLTGASFYTIASKYTVSSPAAPAHPCPSVPCRDMWRLWLEGDDRSAHVPYCRYGGWTTKTDNYAAAARVMEVLTQIAIDQEIVDSVATLVDVVSADPSATERIFDQVFPRFVDQFTATAQHYIHATHVCQSIAT
ncbi:Aste57867_5619 [Aphanomyces stellatus]|uniref:Aste57867_5619 protein n=1 Tax=Aphanomyces stellatus TaxID=120398 RepID=A0A485KGS1_9STRA|nr:hypothetical protein As57867_005606 [Aphanomyces stellatus]VFT82665.1 Aste57867_5619 [Aphanomyces stellatus]